MNEVFAAGLDIDTLEQGLAMFPAAEMPVEHIFTPGLYCRKITIPAGTLLTSMQHKTRHPFVILKGRIGVRSGTEEVIYEAGHNGITEPGTRRVLYAFLDTVWMTFHVTNHTDIEQIAAEILEPASNPLLSEGQGNQWRNQSPKIEES